MPDGNTLIDQTARSARERRSTNIPAVILVTPEASLQVAALTLLDRLIVAISRADAGPITLVSKQTLPPLKRTHALGIRYETAPDLPTTPGPVLFATTNLLVQPADIRRCIETGSRLLSSTGAALDFGVIVSVTINPMALLTHLPTIQASGVASQVTDSTSARAAEASLWASLASSSDGLVDRFFNRPCGRPLSKLLIHTSITPNFVSIASILIGVISAVLFAFGTYHAMLAGALLLQLSAIIDCVDGDIARVLFKETPIGKWIDLAGDQIVHVSVFAGIAIGVAKSAGAPELLWLGVSAVLGALFSFAVVLRGMRSSSGQNSALKRLIDAATNRDFSILVLLLAFLDLTKIFLWLAAVGSHLFWIAALSVQSFGRASARKL